TARNRSRSTAQDSRPRRERACVSWRISSDGRKRLVVDAVHCGLKIVADVRGKAQSLDNAERAQQGEHANVVQRQFAVDGERMLDQSIQLPQVGRQRGDVLARICAKLGQIPERLALAYIVMLQGSHRTELG